MSKYKHVKFPDDLFNRIETEKESSGVNANSIVVIAVDEYLKKKEKERAK